jgi:hypothetical protein
MNLRPEEKAVPPGLLTLMSLGGYGGAINICLPVKLTTSQFTVCSQRIFVRE